MRKDSTVRTKPVTTAIIGACLGLFAAQAASADPEARMTDWPKIESAIATDPALEARVASIVAGMTLEQKVGQMTQPEIKKISPEDVRKYYIGSVLNGGGSWPAMNKHSTVGDWLALAQAYHEASTSTDAKVPIPVIWGIDAVHGNSNVLGATLFPHNIGLGAAHDPELIERIGEATGQSTRATGIGWVFAPTLAVVQDPRWGRTYESFSSDGRLVHDYAAAYIRGLQGTFADDGNVVATAKHFIGDGATAGGDDQGVSVVSRDEMINVHGQGYYGAISAGVQTLMVSYSSWNDVGSGVDHGKMHGARTMIEGVAKEKFGFDGFVVSDWNGIGQVPGCTNASCPQAINAGIDMIMVPDDWKEFISNTVRQVQAGEIPMARIDDAVTRILRVKLRAGLFDHAPTDSRYAGKADALVHRDLARRAVRESLVLLKNEGAVLPLRPGRRVLVVGKSAENLSNQAGGWSLTWQGTENVNADYTASESILAGLRTALGDAAVSYSATGKDVDAGSFDVVVAVIGETPYAEMIGDIDGVDTLGHSRRFPEDLAALDAAVATGKPVVTVFLSGRPLYVNDLLNRSQAFVAAWLPGSEGGGVADVLVAGADGKPRHDFTGRLSFPWPAEPCPPPTNRPDPAHPPLFGLGYGLSYAAAATVAKLPEPVAARCAVSTSLPIFRTSDVAPFALQLQAGDAVQPLGSDLNAVRRWPDAAPVLEVATVQVNTQQDAKQVTWSGAGAIVARSATPVDLRELAKADAALAFDLVLVHAPTAPVRIGMECGAGCRGDVDIAPLLAGKKPGERIAIKLPLSCFIERGVDPASVLSPFGIAADAPFAAAFANVRIVAGGAKDADATPCPKVDGAAQR